MPKRVYELASLLGITNDEMANILLKNGVATNDYVDFVDDKYVRKIESQILGDLNNSLSHKNKSSLNSIEIIGLFNKKIIRYRLKTILIYLLQKMDVVKQLF